MQLILITKVVQNKSVTWWKKALQRKYFRNVRNTCHFVTIFLDKIYHVIYQLSSMNIFDYTKTIAIDHNRESAYYYSALLLHIHSGKNRENALMKEAFVTLKCHTSYSWLLQLYQSQQGLSFEAAFDAHLKTFFIIFQ